MAFSLLVNGARSTTRAKRVENEIGVLLASFHRPVDDAPTVQTVEADIVTQALGSGVGRHRVGSGEDLNVIASRYQVSVDDLLTANPRIQLDRVVVGQWIDIPRRAGAD